jgi:hypothetical protein
MNCRPFAAAAVVLAGLVPIAQAANAETPTPRLATATATILQATTNDPAARTKVVGDRLRSVPDQSKARFIGPDGTVSNSATPGSRRLIIFDLP